MTDREKLIELLESVPHPQRLYPDLFVDMLIENGVRVVVQCKNCKYARESEYALEFDGVTPLCECDYCYMPNRWHEYCSWAEPKKD